MASSWAVDAARGYFHNFLLTRRQRMAHRSSFSPIMTRFELEVTRNAERPEIAQVTA